MCFNERRLCFAFLAVSACWVSSALPIIGAAEDQTSQQAEKLEKAVLSAPDSEANRLSLGTFYLQIGQNRRAAAMLQDYLHAHPQAVKSLRLIAVACLREEDFANAKEYAHRALQVEPADAGSMRVLAMAEVGLQETDAAELLLRASLKLEPDSVDTDFQLGLLYTKKRENLSEAVKLLEKARRLQPAMAGIHTALGSALLASGKPEAAAESLQRAVKLDPDSAESFYVLADAYRQMHQTDKAQGALREFEAQTKAAADRRGREMRSRAFYEQGVQLLSNTDKLDEAYAQFQKALDELPSFDAAYYRLAQVNYLKGDLPHALSSIREALKRNGWEPEYYYVEAKCLESTDSSGALAAIRKAVALRPGVADFEDLLRKLQGGSSTRK